jgi:hypothetical protein
MKVIINTQYGGFGLSKHAVKLYHQYAAAVEPARERMPTVFSLGYTSADRADPVLVRVVEELGSEANGEHAKLKVIEIPDDVKWTIEEYDGVEWVAEVHRRWE